MGRGAYIINTKKNTVETGLKISAFVIIQLFSIFNRSVGLRPATASTAWATPMVAMSKLGLVIEWVEIR